eukprot:SAG31_NODE_3612_length_4067_cov_13.889617_4_plen_282_part_00
MYASASSSTRAASASPSCSNANFKRKSAPWLQNSTAAIPAAEAAAARADLLVLALGTVSCGGYCGHSHGGCMVVQECESEGHGEGEFMRELLQLHGGLLTTEMSCWCWYWCCCAFVDRFGTELPGAQPLLARRAAAATEKGVPVVCVIFHGGSLALEPLVDACDAIFDAHHPGQSGAAAVVDAIFGKLNPSGRLSTTRFPASFTTSYRTNMTDMRIRGGPALPALGVRCVQTAHARLLERGCLTQSSSCFYRSCQQRVALRICTTPADLSFRSAQGCRSAN